MKFNKLSKNNINFAKFVVESIFDTKSINFYSYTINKRGTYFNKAFGGNEWIAYEEITLKLLEASLSKQEILILIADHITTPKGIKFEVNTKRNFNQKNKRLALAGVCRFDSKSNDLLQVIDLIIGAITYDIKLTEGIVSGSKYKIELVDFLKSKLGVTSFSSGFKNHSFNVFVDQTKSEK